MNDLLKSLRWGVYGGGLFIPPTAMFIISMSLIQYPIAGFTWIPFLLNTIGSLLAAFTVGFIGGFILFWMANTNFEEGEQ